jgi:hypothetical protein
MAADALTMKVREGGRVVKIAVMVATGVNIDGYREVLHTWIGRYLVEGVAGPADRSHRSADLRAARDRWGHTVEAGISRSLGPHVTIRRLR